jgi:putative acetyltransferase
VKKFRLRSPVRTRGETVRKISASIDSMFIRPAHIGDMPKIPALVEAAFGRHDEAVLVEALRRDNLIALEFVATILDTHVGHLVLSRLNAPPGALALAPLSVHPDHQRRGVGSALVRAAADRAEEDGWSAIFVLGDPAYYAKFGFSVSEASGFETPYAREYTAALVLDPAAFGTLSREIDYPEAFGCVG